MEELNAALHKFNQNIVDASRQVCRDSIAFCMTQVILPLLEKIGELDVRFKCSSPLPNEAYFQGMKTSCVNEFELTVILTHLLTAKTFEDVGSQDSTLSCYGHILPHQAPHPLGDVLVEAGSPQGIVSALRIRQIFAQLVSQAASVLDLHAMGLTLEIFLKEPYTIVKIFRGSDIYVFELVPAFVFPGQWPQCAAAWPEENNDWLTENEVKVIKEAGFYAQALPCPSSPGDPSLFRISFSMAEKYLLRATPSDNASAVAASAAATATTDSSRITAATTMTGTNAGPVARRGCERILKMIRESDKDDFSPLSSYHIKTVLLHECSRHPDAAAWGADRLGERFLQLFRDLILVLDSRELPHFFVRDCDLLRQYSPEVLNAAAGRLRLIYQDICMSSSNSIHLSVD